MGQRKNELRKTARIPAPRNECGNSERAIARERTGDAYSPAIIITPATANRSRLPHIPRLGAGD